MVYQRVHGELVKRFGTFYEHPGYWVESVRGYRFMKDWYAYIVRDGILYRVDISAIELDDEYYVNISEPIVVRDMDEITRAVTMLDVDDLMAVLDRLMQGGTNVRFV